MVVIKEIGLSLLVAVGAVATSDLVVQAVRWLEALW
jgi:hypothetical protein